MDNLAHTLSGMVLARAGLDRRSRFAAPALIVGANLPDVDLFWSVGNEVRYLHFHRGWTHSLFGVVVLSLLLWVALGALSRLVPTRASPVPLRPLPLLAVSAIGVCSHFLMDSANSYGVRPFLPWNDRWVYGDLWVIVDPWVWLMLGGWVNLSSRKSWARSSFWLLGAAATSGLMFAMPSVPRPACWGWLLGAGAVAFLRFFGPGWVKTPCAGRVCLCLLVLYAAGCAAAGGLARARLERLAGAELPQIREIRHAALPRPADPFHWDGIVEAAETVYHRSIGVVTGFDPSGAAFERYDRQHHEPSVEAVLASCPGRALLGFTRFPVAVLEHSDSGESVVVLRDLRYARSQRTGFGVYSVPVAEDGSPELDGLACPRLAP